MSLQKENDSCSNRRKNAGRSDANLRVYEECIEIEVRDAA